MFIYVHYELVYIFKMFLGMSKYESTSYLCTLFDITCCQSVIRKLVYGFMFRLDNSVKCIIKGILVTRRNETFFHNRRNRKGVQKHENPKERWRRRTICRICKIRTSRNTERNCYTAKYHSKNRQIPGRNQIGNTRTSNPPLPKLGKKQGPSANLRSIILLSLIRKILAICLIRRCWDRLSTRIFTYCWTNGRLIQLELRPSERRAHDMTATFIFHLPLGDVVIVN